MKNCIVLSGEYRSFPKTKENLIKFIEVNDLDVYCHLWSTDESEINDIIDSLKPKKILVEDYADYKQKFEDIENRVKEKNRKKSTIDSISNNASMNYGRMKAFELVDQQEYDLLVYSRYDIAFSNIFSLVEIDKLQTPTEESYNIISDIFCITPMQYAKYYFIFDVFEELHSTRFEPLFDEYLRYTKVYGEDNIQIHTEERYCPHMVLLRHIFNNKVPHEEVFIPVRIQR